MQRPSPPRTPSPRKTPKRKMRRSGNSTSNPAHDRTRWCAGQPLQVQYPVRHAPYYYPLVTPRVTNNIGTHTYGRNPPPYRYPVRPVMSTGLYPPPPPYTRVVRPPTPSVQPLYRAPVVRPTAVYNPSMAQFLQHYNMANTSTTYTPRFPNPAIASTSVGYLPIYPNPVSAPMGNNTNISTYNINQPPNPRPVTQLIGYSINTNPSTSTSTSTSNTYPE